MTEEKTPFPVTADERRLIFSLREIPDSPLRDRVVTLVHRLVQLASEPRCLESQADGVPCESEKGHCDACSLVSERVRDAFEQSFPAPARLVASSVS